MGQEYPGIEPRLREFIEAQHVFFVATAPRDGGRVNLSPKGIDGTLQVVDEHTVAYLDITASGAETIAHLRENGRITVMFCSFDRAPKILRLQGTGRVITPYDQEWPAWSGRFPATPAARAVVVVEVQRVADTCGYGLPLMDYAGERDLLVPAIERKGAQGILDYRRQKNRVSIDGLPAFDYDPA